MIEKQKEPKPVANPEQGDPTVRSPFDLIRGLFKKSEATQIEEIEALRSELPQGDIPFDPETGLSISVDGATTKITQESKGIYDVQSSLVINADDQGRIEKIEYTLHQDNGTGTIPPIERAFDPSSPEESTLELREVIDYLEDASLKAQRAT